jgi:hypothetical protein
VIMDALASNLTPDLSLKMEMGERRVAIKKPDFAGFFGCAQRNLAQFPGLRFGLGLQHLATTVKTGRADVVTQMGFAGGRLNSNTWHNQGIVRTVHTALGWGFLVLLNGHVGLLSVNAASVAAR